eukprot:SAG22_NODE_7124_length_773_cov_1.053412_2_plen_113_part_00
MECHHRSDLRLELVSALPTLSAWLARSFDWRPFNGLIAGRSVVDFGSMLQTFPNYYSLGPNIQFFAAHGVRGVFEEGPGVHTGDGTDMEELKDYVRRRHACHPAPVFDHRTY